MLKVNQLTGFNVGGTVAASLNYIGSTTLQNPSDPCTFTSAAIGTADAGRRVFVVIAVDDNSATFTINTVTIGGISATIHVQASDTEGAVGIASAIVPTGTTANIVVDTSLTSPQDVSCSVYAAYNVVRTTPYDTDFDNANDPSQTAVDIPDGGFVIAGCQHGNSGVAFVITGVTADYQATTPEAGFRWGSGHAKNLSAQTARLIQFDGGTGDSASVAVSWV